MLIFLENPQGIAIKTFNDTTRKLSAAVLLGPLLIVPVMLLSFFLLTTFGGGTYPAEDLAMTCLIMSVWGLPIAYPVTLFILVPTFLLLKRFDRDSLLFFLIASLTLATPVALRFGYGILYATLFCFYFAFILAFGFWLVYNRCW